MPVSPQFRSGARENRFVADRRGNVTMIFGLSVTMLFALGGGAVDYARFVQTKAKTQAALDTATLAGGRALQVTFTSDSATVAINAANEYYSKMKADAAGTATPVFTVTENGTVLKGELTLAVDNLFLKLLGLPKITSVLASETVIASGANAGSSLEISLMLDTTGSMSGQKILDLKAAAKDLVDIVVWSDQSQYSSKVALAPFSSHVNVGPYITSVTDLHATRTNGGNTYNAITCVTERTGTEAFTDAAPVGANTLPARSGETGNAAKNNAANYSTSGDCKTSGWFPSLIPEILPLSSNKTTLKDRIDALPAAGSTAGALGTAWAWYLLSPNWNSVWQGTSAPAPYADLTTMGPKNTPKLYKVAVLMTDGVYNTTGGNSYGDASTEAQTIAANAVTLCTNMKAAGIKVYTVGFQLDNELAVSTMKSCASRKDEDPADQPSYFFNTSTGDELKGAFRQIALQLSTLRIRK